MAYQDPYYQQYANTGTGSYSTAQQQPYTQSYYTGALQGQYQPAQLAQTQSRTGYTQPSPYANQQQQYGTPYNQMYNNRPQPRHVPSSSISSSTNTSTVDQKQQATRNFLTSSGATTQPFASTIPSLATDVGGPSKSELDAGLNQPRKRERISGIACIGRTFACSLFIFLYLAISIILTIGLYIRPPAISVGQPQVDPTNPVQLSGSNISLNLAVPIFVDNPNFFSVSFKRIEADVIYPINSAQIGEGDVDDIVFDSHASKNFSFPFSFTYSSAIDSDSQILTDLLTKCGVLGTSSDIQVTGKLTLGIKITVFTVSPSFSKDFSFPCPQAFSAALKTLTSSI